ncbi:hypothetical protein CEXT_638081 [Caerostris extrusa]|uniref:Uncharacterized protein n=1 Tax=Caerostris extrusa TaxID=172846 RepID=A0AAV4WNQ9_CAEEX|nr:hypothetical protein CEXT_638081 [Caerostris extrusa]
MPDMQKFLKHKYPNPPENRVKKSLRIDRTCKKILIRKKTERFLRHKYVKTASSFGAFFIPSVSPIVSGMKTACKLLCFEERYTFFRFSDSTR